MRKLQKLLVLLLGVGASGCTPYVNPDGSKVYPMGAQKRVVVQVFNLCTPEPGVVYRSDGIQHLVPPGRPTWLGLEKEPFQESGYVAATYQVVRNYRVVGSVTRSWYIDNYTGSHNVQWIIGGGHNGGGQHIYTDQVTDGTGRNICQ